MTTSLPDLATAIGLACCRTCGRTLDFAPKSDLISYYCSIPCYHGGKDDRAGARAVLLAPELANAIAAVQIAHARQEGADRGYALALALHDTRRRPRRSEIDRRGRRGVAIFGELDETPLDSHPNAAEVWAARDQVKQATAEMVAVALAFELP